MASKFLKNPNGGVYKDSNGKLVKVDLSLPTLSNPATAEDIASGKEAINENGVVVTGTMEVVENKLPLLVGTQSADNLYDITADDLDGVTVLGDYAFYQKKGLRSIDLSNVTSIGASAFYYCSYLTSANMPNVTSIGASCFRGCGDLMSADMPNVTSIGNDAFYQCSDLTTANIPNVTILNSNVFYGCANLTSVNLPNATSIGGATFRGCTDLTSVSIPKITSIGGNVFVNCSSLTSLTIPSTCTSIGSYALQCGSSSNKCTFTFERTTPPTISSNTFNASYINKIIVPKGCGDAYKTATNWSNYAGYIEEATA